MTKTAKNKIKTIHGKPCNTCGGTERYAGNNNCVSCRQSRASNQVSLDTTPKPPKRDRDWPRFLTAANDSIPKDPIAVMIERETMKRLARGKLRHAG